MGLMIVARPQDINNILKHKYSIPVYEDRTDSKKRYIDLEKS